MSERGTFEELRRSRQTMWRTRWLLVVLGVVLSVALVLSGAVVIGAIVGAMALVRAALIVQWQRRPPWRAQRFGGQSLNR